MKPELNDRQKRFILEYLVDLNSKQAAARAGYSPGTAAKVGSRLMQDPRIKAAIEIAKARREQQLHIDAAQVLVELARIGFSDPRRLVDENGRLKQLQDLDDNTAHAVASVEVVTRGDGDEVEHTHKYKFWDKNSALTNLGKHLAMFIERRELTGKGGGPLEHRLDLDIDDEQMKRIADAYLSTQ